MAAAIRTSLYMNRPSLNLYSVLLQFRRRFGFISSPANSGIEEDVESGVFAQGFDL
jgi:hypothetical protein